MSQTTQRKRARFRELHEAGCFVLPNPWDVGSARMLEHLGFEAIARRAPVSPGRPVARTTRWLGTMCWTTSRPWPEARTCH
jgi:hypothetical protein